MIQLQDITHALQASQTIDQLDQIYDQYCGKQGIITQAFKQF